MTGAIGGDNMLEPGAGSGHLPVLDGLRGLAVVAVVAYHLEIPGVGGGFLGVDVFFALSGFLITRGLVGRRPVGGAAAELSKFWHRRIRRLWPALWVTVVATVVVAPLVWADQVDGIRQDALASLLQVSNWWFIFDEQTYAEAFGQVSPLRHTWSLSIEFQWYLAWPLAVLALRRSPMMLRRVTLAALFGATVLSAGLLGAGFPPSDLFDATPVRAPGLLAGALVAVIGVDTVGSRLPGWAGTASVVLMVPLFVVADELDSWLFAGGFTVVAIGSAVAIAALGRESARGLDRAVGGWLSVRPLAWCGSRSYAIYLWHWPIIVGLTRSATGWSWAGVTVARLVATLVLAELSWHLVEWPARRRAVPDDATRRLGPGLTGGLLGLQAAAVLALVALLAASTPEAERRFAAPVLLPGEGMVTTRQVVVVGGSGAVAIGTPPPAAAGVDAGQGGQSAAGESGRASAVVSGAAGAGDTSSAGAASFVPDVVNLGEDGCLLVDVSGPCEVRVAAGDLVILVPGLEDAEAAAADPDGWHEGFTRRRDDLLARGVRLAAFDLPCPSEAAPPDEIPDETGRQVVNEVLHDQSPESVELISMSFMFCEVDDSTRALSGFLRLDGSVFGTIRRAEIWNWITHELLARRTLAADGQMPERVLILGDSVATNLTRAITREVTPGRFVGGRPVIGCGLLDTMPVHEGAALVSRASCDQRAALWDHGLRVLDPDVVLLVSGAWEVFDQELADGSIAVAGTEQHRRLLDEALDALAQQVAEAGGRLVVALPPCPTAPLDDATPELTEIRRDARRSEAVRAVVTAVAARRGDVSEATYGSIVCEDSGEDGGLRMKAGFTSDGLHLSPEGAEAVLRRLDDVLAGA